MSIRRLFIAFLSCAAMAAAQQAAERVAPPKIDPKALEILKKTTDTLKGRETFSFRAVIQRELVAPNDQVLTFVRRNEVAVARPGRVRINITGERDKVEVYFSNGELFLYSPSAKEYVGLGTSSLDLDRAVDRLEASEIALPMSPLFRSDPYRNLVEGLESAAVLSPVEIDGKTFQHLAFMKKEVEWQLWIDGATSLPRRAQAVYRAELREPRMIVDFSDWNLSPNIPAEYYVFQRPAGAKAIPAIDIREVK